MRGDERMFSPHTARFSDGRGEVLHCCHLQSSSTPLLFAGSETMIVWHKGEEDGTSTANPY